MAVQLMHATRAVLGKAPGRFSRHYSLASNPFTTTSDYSQFQLDEQALKEDMATIPPAPKHRPELHIYSNIVKPQDTCDLFFKPDINDIVVTSLAKSCAIHGDSQYEVVSKSTVNESNFVFANIAIQWMNDFKSGIYPLTDVSERKAFLSYSNATSEKQVLDVFDEHVTSSVKSLTSFFAQVAEKKIPLDVVTKVLLPRLKTASEYGLLIDHLNSHHLELNPRTLKEFLAVMLEDLSSNATLERVEKFEEFFTDKLMSINPNLLEELDPATLAQLAYVTTSSSTLSTSSQALSLMVDTYKAAPPKPVYELFMSRFRKLAMKEDHSREKILKDLSPLKSIIHHYGMSLTSFDFLMNHAIMNSQDLSIFVKFAKQTSPVVLSQRAQDVLAKLTSLQSKESKSPVVKDLQKSQLTRILSQAIGPEKL